jgi:hypothetical protein
MKRLLSVVMALVAISAMGNLIKDGNFKTGRLSNEAFLKGKRSAIKYEVVKDTEAGNCVRMELVQFSKGANGKAVNSAFGFGGETRKGGFPVKPNTTYKFSLKVKGTAMIGFQAIECYGNIRWKNNKRLKLAPKNNPQLNKDKWISVEKIFSTTSKAKSAIVAVQFWWDEKYGPMTEKYSLGDYVLISDIKVEELVQNSVMRKGFQYYWREIEDAFKGHRFKTSKWTPINSNIKYSGKGAGGMNKSSALWNTNIQAVIDQKTLMPKPITYYLWLRIYGHLDSPEVSVSYDGGSRARGKIGTFKVKANEQLDASGKYAGPGKFYWQKVGSFTSSGGMTKLKLKAHKQFYGDALLITDDPEYYPKGFKARKVAMNKLKSFKILKSSEKIYIDASYQTFGITDQFTTPLNFLIFAQSGTNVIRSADEPAYIYLALPQWAKAVGVISHWASEWSKRGTAGKHVLEKTGTKIIQNKIYDVYRCSTYKLISRFRFFVRGIKSHIKYGTMDKAYFWMVDGKNTTSKRSMNIEAVKVKRAPQFKNIFIGPMGGSMGTFFKAYSDIPETLKFCGINMINTWDSDQMSLRGLSAISKNFIKRCNALGIAVIDQLGPGYKYWKIKPEYAKNQKGKQAVHCLALSMDGDSPYIKEFQAGIERIVKAGHSGLCFDDEVFNSAYDTIDFSDKFIAMFKQHLAKTQPDLKFVSPKTFVKQRNKYPKLYAKWIDYRCSRVTNWYRLYREAYDMAMKKYRSSSTFGKTYFIPVIVNCRNYEEAKQRLCFDLKAIMKYSSHISPMIYTYNGIPQSAMVGNSIKSFKRLLATKRNIVAPTLLGGHRSFGEIPQKHMRMVKYQIYECLINKAPGMFFWYTAGFMNPQTLSQVSTALNATVKYENFFTNGKIVKASIVPKNLRIDVLKFGNYHMVYASAYTRGDNPVNAEITIPGASFNNAVDVETGESLPIFGNSVKIKFDKEYGRMLLLK